MISILSNSLPRFIVVPQKVLDTELKKSFAHFNEGRIPVSMSGFVGRSRVSLLRPKSRRFSLPMCSFSHCVLRCSAGVGDTPWAAICCGWPVFRTTSIMRKMTSGGCVRARVWVFRLAFSARGWEIWAFFVVEFTGQKHRLLANISGFALTPALAAAKTK